MSGTLQLTQKVKIRLGTFGKYVDLLVIGGVKLLEIYQTLVVKRGILHALVAI